ncbi:unnamed protein product [Rotaria sordida]|uniref:RING-type domain-containing protein n=1 Tax=Rotaria sordida TaxID=392033 RepID=A0A814PAN5_9BILA|nr:unnamed protein product [Rotaria sordida]CAF1080922.1 unnamed protein product [Rotaria sordida]CAF1102740.1 unnamed protein product [Rotaria sordida]
MSSNIDHESICNICNRSFNEPQCFPCRHIFCKTCIIQWFEKNNTLCPICRQSVSINDVTDVDPIVHKNIDDICNNINKEHFKVNTHNLLSNNKSSQNEQQDQLYQQSPTILAFEPLRSIFAEVFNKNQQLNEKTNQLEKEIHQEHDTYINDLQDINKHLNTFVDQYSNRLNKDQIQIDEIRTENQCLNKQVNEQIIKCNELQRDNRFLKEKIDQIEQQYQNHIKELESTNHHLDTCVTQLTNQLNSVMIQIKRIEDECQQQVKEVNQYDDRLIIYKIQNEQLKQQVDAQCIQYNELQNENRIFKEQIKKFEQQYQQDHQTHFEALNHKITQLNDQLNNYDIQIKGLEDENTQLKIQSQTQHEAYMKELKDTLYHQSEQLNNHEKQIQELQSKNQKLEVQIDEQMRQYIELSTDNRSLKEQVQQIEQQCQQTDQLQIKELENTNNRLDAFIEQFNDYLDHIQIQASKVNDENEQEYPSNITEINNTNDRYSSCFTQLSGQSTDDEPEVDDQSQKKARIPSDEHEDQPEMGIKYLTKRGKYVLDVNQYQNPKLEQKIQQQKSNSQVYLKGQKLIDQDMDMVIKEAIINKQCTWLYLSSNKITSVCVSILAEALNNNKTLERLYLSDNQVCDDGVSSLVKILSLNNNILKRLNLTKNGITERGAKYLAEMIKANNILTHLYLGENEINDHGVQILSDAIENYNTTIKYLDLSSNKLLTDESIDSLLQMIKNNTSLNKIQVYNCSLSGKGKQRLKTSEQSKENFKVCVNSFFD